MPGYIAPGDKFKDQPTIELQVVSELVSGLSYARKLVWIVPLLLVAIQLYMTTVSA